MLYLARQLLHPATRAEVAAVILNDGFIVGTWQMKKEGDSYLFHAEPLTGFEEYETASIEKRIDEIAHFLGTDDYEIR